MKQISLDLGIEYPNGMLAEQAGERIPLSVCKSNAGFYIGTMDHGDPFTRESNEYWHTAAQAWEALTSGQWTQRTHL